jgi:hypothetical protein
MDNGRVFSLGFVLSLSLLVCVILVVPASGASRYKVSSEGVISDSKTGLEWVVGPNKPTSYNEANSWVEDCKIAGGGWRLPTRDELLGLYSPGVGFYNIDPVFKVKTNSSTKSPDGRDVGMLFVWAKSPDLGALEELLLYQWW